ncbi:sensor domain-containing protein [Stenotrophomonas pictorum]|nr:EAL domain-containing protein [Stenotrophomonas pictorum]
MEQNTPGPASAMLPFFSAALEQIGNGVILFDEQNRIMYVNAAMEAICGWPRAQLLGRNLGVLAPPAVRERYDTRLYPGDRNRISELSAQPHDIKLVRADGSECWISVALSTLSAGTDSLRMALIRDVTVQRQQQERGRLLSLGFDETHSAVLITDGEGRIVQLNKGFGRLFGFAEHQAIGQYLPALLAPGSHGAAQMDADTRQLKAGEPIQRDERLYRHNGQPLWCSVSTNPIFDDYGTLVNQVVVLMDITRTKVHELLQHKMLDALVREVPTAEVLQMMCLEVERIAPEVISSVLRVEDGKLRTLAGPSLPDPFSRLVDGVIAGPRTGSCGTAAYTGETVIARDIATDPNWADIPHRAVALAHGLAACWSTPIKASDGRVLGTFAFYYRQPHDPDEFHHRLVAVIVHLCALALEREEARNRIRRLAFYDDLTGLPNRSLLHAQADQAISAAGHAGQELAVLFIDLDRFKQVNDSMGHPGGDTLLRTVARRLQEEAGPRDIVGRLSGDEFVVVLAPCDAQAALERGERLLHALSQPWQLGEVEVRSSASIGISVFPHDGGDMETLLQNADMAMYQAKHSGRARVRFYCPEMNQSAQERLTMEAALREALQHHQLQLHYQPQIDIADGHLHSVEALARWQHPTLGTVPPIRFIALAEECGLIGEIGQWALAQACKQLASWRRDGLQVPSVAVNLSPTDFHDAGLPARIAQILQREALVATDLTVEITEDILLDTDPTTLRTLHEVHALGVRLSMDDFGTGYSSLSYLRQLPISELKLDRSFVCGIEEDPIACALTQAIAHIGQSLQLKVVAEGVESQAQLRLLGQQGYQIAQGFHFTAALPAPALAQWVREHLAAPVAPAVSC